MFSVRAPFSPFLGADHLMRLRRDQLGFYRDMQRRYGDSVRLRLGPYRLWLMFHPDQIEAVLTAHAGAFIRFERVMRILAQWNGQSLLISEGARWRERRRRVLPAFSTRRLPGYAELAVRQAEALAKAWERRATAGGLLDVDTDLDMALLSLRIAISTLFGGTTSDGDTELGAAVAALSDIAFRESTSPLRTPDWLPFASKRRKAWAVKTLWDAVDAIVQERLRGSQQDKGDLLSMLIEHTDGNPQDLRNEVVTLMIAGHETSGAALSWASYLLAGDAKALGEVQAEIAAVIGDRPPTLADLDEMPAVRAVLAETLRLFPPAYALFARQPVEACTVAGVPLSRGDLVQIVPFVTQRDERWFDEPEAFRPSRFRGAARWPRCAYLPFGGGPRVCIGQGFSLMETALVLITLLQRFTPLPVKGPVVPEPKFSLRPRGGLPQSWRLRD